MGVGAKPAASKIPVWLLLLAPQFLDVFFILFTIIGLEGIHPEGNLETYGQFKGNITYSHSLVGAILISAGAFWIGKRFYETNYNGWALALLSFSHWPIDLLVHHHDMAILPGNIGDLPLLGFEGWNYPKVIYGTEVAMAAIALALYLSWKMKNRSGTRWYVGPLVILVLFGAQAAFDFNNLPR